MYWINRYIILVALILGGTPASADSKMLIGRASVIDGDTIEIKGQRIRINGIDAPESRQICLDGSGLEYKCGQRSANMLDTYVHLNQPISCHLVGRDRYKRLIATCFTSHGDDLAEWMVLKGQALDWPKYSKGKYDHAQDDAMKSSSGLWQGDFVVPWEWRKLPKQN